MGPRLKCVLVFEDLFGLEWTNKALFKGNSKNGNWVLLIPIGNTCITVIRK